MRPLPAYPVVVASIPAVFSFPEAHLWGFSGQLEPIHQTPLKKVGFLTGAQKGFRAGSGRINSIYDSGFSLGCMHIRVGSVAMGDMANL